MAKVYSWQIQKNPAIYAYIVNPLEVDKTNPNAYVGTELKGIYLENIKNWVKDCTIDVYKTQFEKMKTLCTTKGYEVDFENPEIYFNVAGECDNLRGPAGRGIKYIGLKASSPEQNEYIIYYDDDTSYTFTVLNGTNGKDGKNGEPGARGDAGVSSKIIMIYKSADKRPDKPEGGSYNFETNTFVYPEGWNAVDASTLVPPVWMSSRTFTTSASSTDIEWSIPVQITGENGEPGADGTSIEFLYMLSDEEPSVYGLESPNTPGYEPPVDSGWTNHPSGVNEDKNTTEWCTTRRTRQDENGKTVWGPWEKAFIWSKYGTNGQDGDGVQYIFLKNTGEIPLNPTPENYNNVDSEIYKSYQNKTNEWIPESNVEYRNFKGQTVKYVELDDNVGIWTDNPTDITPIYHSQWVCVRKYTKNENGRMEWGAYSEPALWGRYGQEGKSATSIRKLYALSNSTSEPPTLPTDSIITGDWGSGFPVDYVAGENVVWGTEAEIWGKDNTFVYSYKVVSSNRPSDAEDNDIYTVSTLPETEIPGYKYVCVNDKYYQWTGGWCKPYLVTGLKGEPGSPIDYTIYVFAFARADKAPLPPNGTKDAPGFVFYEDGTRGDYLWTDFPDTTKYGVDGDIKEGGHVMRWYQCVGYVNGFDNSIKKWDNAVYPCNGQDGTPGRYTEFRFAVTKNQTAPNIIQFDDNNNVYRIPKLLNEKGEEIDWVDTDENLPQIPTGGAMWQIWATIDNSNNEEKVIINNNKAWNGPRRVSGEQGPQGEQGPKGPAGLQGATGLPGASLIQMYCLGTYGTDGECYFNNYTQGDEIGDGYFGSDNWKNNVLTSEMTDWYEGENMPLSSIIEVYNEDTLNSAVKNINNIGRVIKFTNVDNKVKQYYLVVKDENGEITKKTLTSELSEDVDFNVYVWCIQGSEIKNNEGLTTEVKWGKPFKLQGTNGLRGLSGQRGQVVYPMGVYNLEEVYTTTEDKAPYVYDPNDGMYYVYNIVNEPWVGLLPENYQTIMVHPTDINNNYEDVSVNPEGYTSEVTTKKYLRFEDKYYIWDNKIEKYVLASKYKYSVDGTGGENTWMTDQNGVTPSKNYGNATDNNTKPAWVRFESFQALYTSIGIIANGMIGSAVYNNEFMFSQQGVAQDGKTKTTYANVSGENTEYGFLSGYEYDENGKEIDGVIRHWKYKNTNTYINNTAVNPYEKDENGKYIHTFMPNVCINFATGQMWLSTGKIRFGTLGDTNILTDAEVAEKLAAINNKLNEIAKDNEVCDDEKEFLIEELNAIEKDYNDSYENFETQIGQLFNNTIEGQNYLNEYKDAYNKAKDALLKYTQESAGGECITIEEDFNDISNYYTQKDLLIQRINIRLPKVVADFEASLTGLISTVSGHTENIKTLNTNIGGLSGSVSGLTNQITTIENTTTKLEQDYNSITQTVDKNKTETDGKIKTINDTVSEIRTTVDNIELKVGGTVSVGVVNLIDRTEFESIDVMRADKISENDNSIKFSIPSRNITGDININQKTNSTYSNSLFLDATDYTIIGPTTEKLYLDVTQNLTSKLKSNTTYTLHYKYKTIKDLQPEPAPLSEESSSTPAPLPGNVVGSVIIEHAYPKWIKIDNNDGLDFKENEIRANLENFFESNVVEWKTSVIRFTTANINDKTVTLYIRSMMGYYIEIADLKLEEGNTPTTWSKSPEDISTKFAQIKVTADGITQEVKNLTVGGQNLLDRTEFKIDDEGNTDIFDSTIKDTKYFTLEYGIESDKSKCGYGIFEKTSDDINTNILHLNCKPASNEKDSLKVLQNLTGVIKSNTTYTLHCKYKTAYVQQYNANAGSFGIEGVNPSWVNINGNDISGLSNNAEVILPLKILSGWNSLVIKFTTGSLSNTVSFSVKANAYSSVEICDLKLEEGKIPTSWSTSPKDVSSQIKQTADSITLNVTEKFNNLSSGGQNLIDRTEFNYDGTGTTGTTSVITATSDTTTKPFSITKETNSFSGFTSSIYAKNGTYTNSLKIDASNYVKQTGSTAKYVDAIQNLTGIIKSNSTYTLHCKYKTTYKEITENNELVSKYPGGLFITMGDYTQYLEIDNEVKSNSTDLAGFLDSNITEWKTKVIKFKTGNVKNTNQLYIRCYIGSTIEICDLKLEEGNIPTTWNNSQKDTSVKFAQMSITADEIRSEVRNVSVGGQNLLDRTEFNYDEESKGKINISGIEYTTGSTSVITDRTNTNSSYFDLVKRNLTQTEFYIIDKSGYNNVIDTNSLVIDARSLIIGTGSTNYSDAIQYLNKKLKPNSTYTLHCKYKAMGVNTEAYSLPETYALTETPGSSEAPSSSEPPNSTEAPNNSGTPNSSGTTESQGATTTVGTYPGALYITFSNATWKNVDDNDINDITSDLATLFTETSEWKTVVIKFSTDDTVGINKSENKYAGTSFIARAMPGYIIEIADLKLEEGKVQTSWSTSPKDVSSQIKQTADSISLSVTSDIEGKLNETGINIKSGEITLNADKTTIKGNLHLKKSTDGIVIYDNEIHKNTLVQITPQSIGEFDITPSEILTFSRTNEGSITVGDNEINVSLIKITCEKNTLLNLVDNSVSCELYFNNEFYSKMEPRYEFHYVKLNDNDEIIEYLYSQNTDTTNIENGKFVNIPLFNVLEEGKYGILIKYFIPNSFETNYTYKIRTYLEIKRYKKQLITIGNDGISAFFGNGTNFWVNQDGVKILHENDYSVTGFMVNRKYRVPMLITDVGYESWYEQDYSDRFTRFGPVSSQHCVTYIYDDFKYQKDMYLTQFALTSSKYDTDTKSFKTGEPGYNYVYQMKVDDEIICVNYQKFQVKVDNEINSINLPSAGYIRLLPDSYFMVDNPLKTVSDGREITIINLSKKDLYIYSVKSYELFWDKQPDTHYINDYKNLMELNGDLVNKIKVAPGYTIKLINLSKMWKRIL